MDPFRKSIICFLSAEMSIFMLTML